MNITQRLQELGLVLIVFLTIATLLYVGPSIYQAGYEAGCAHTIENPPVTELHIIHEYQCEDLQGNKVLWGTTTEEIYRFIQNQEPESYGWKGDPDLLERLQDPPENGVRWGAEWETN